MEQTYLRLLEIVNGYTIIDTHEHLPAWETERNYNTDVINEYLTHYFNRDLISAGLSQADLSKVLDTSIPIIERWYLLEPYWTVCRKTGYGRSLDITVKGLYNIEEINGKTIEELNDAFLKSMKPGWYKHVLKERSKIQTSILDTQNINVDLDIYTVSLHTDTFIFPRTLKQLYDIGEQTGISICSFSTWLEAIHKTLTTAINSGVRVFKSALAYSRSINYPGATLHEAEESFNRLFNNRHHPDWFEHSIYPEESFQNYMMHYILEFANRNKITFQFHTGMHEGNGNILQNSNPTLLSNVFLRYPEVDFDLFHISFPYQEEAGVLAKTFPNVYLDMCWAHIISPAASVRTLYEWLDSVPYNKISAFGADYCMIDPVYGHQILARENICKALTLKITEDTLGFDEACTIAKMVLYDNPVRIFKL